MGGFNSYYFNVFETGLTQSMIYDCGESYCIPGGLDGGKYGTDYLLYSRSYMTLEKCFKLCLMNNFNYSAIAEGFDNNLNN